MRLRIGLPLVLAISATLAPVSAFGASWEAQWDERNRVCTVFPPGHGLAIVMGEVDGKRQSRVGIGARLEEGGVVYLRVDDGRQFTSKQNFFEGTEAQAILNELWTGQQVEIGSSRGIRPIRVRDRLPTEGVREAVNHCTRLLGWSADDEAAERTGSGSGRAELPHLPAPDAGSEPPADRPATDSAKSSGCDIADKLRELAELRSEDLLTDEEFDDLKGRLLDRCRTELGGADDPHLVVPDAAAEAPEPDEPALPRTSMAVPPEGGGSTFEDEPLEEDVAAGQPFESAFQTYLLQPGIKAFAVAMDSGGGWAYGYSQGASSGDAQRAALARCRLVKVDHPVAADCQIIAVDGPSIRQRARYIVDPKMESAILSTAAFDWTNPLGSALGPTGTQHRQAINYELRWANGTAFVIGSTEDLQVWVAFTAGRDPQALVYVVNASDRRITFAPEAIRATAVRSTKSGVSRLAVGTFSATDYEKKVRNKQAWQAFLHGAAAGMANQPQPQRESFSGGYSSYRPFQPGSQLHGSFYGQITRWPTAADYAAARERTAAQVNAMGEQLRASFDAMAATLMRTHTLEPNSFYGGIVHFERFRGERVILTIPFGGSAFVTEFTLP